MKYYLYGFKKYAVFSGRAKRSEYWYFTLFNLIAALFFAALTQSLHSSFFSIIYSLILFFPSLAVAVRRMHDVDKSGWFILIPIYSLILAIRPGNLGENKFGAEPSQ